MSKLRPLKLDFVFKIKDLGKLHYFLGLEFTEVPDSMVVSQRKFTLDLINEFHCAELHLSRHLKTILSVRPEAHLET